MTSQPEKPVPSAANLQAEPSIADLHTNEWWHSQIAEKPNWAPGGVFSLFLGPVSCVAPTAAWFTTAAQLKSTSLFPKILVVTPPGHGDANFRAALCNCIEASYNKNIPDAVSKLIAIPDSFCEDSNCTSIISRIQTLPEGSAIGICAANRLRFHDIVSVSEVSLQAHTGFTARYYTEEELTFPHVHKLLRDLLPLAAAKKYSVVVFIEQFALELESLPSDLLEHDDLAVSSIRDDSAAKARFQTEMRAEAIRKKENPNAAFEHIQKNISEPKYQAYALSQVLAGEERWFEAWNTLKPHLGALRALNDAHVQLNLALTAAACGEAEEAAISLSHAVAVGLKTVEEFNSAGMLAGHIGAGDVIDEILKRMAPAFPDHPMTIARSYVRFMDTQQYAAAAAITQSPGYEFESAWATLLNTNQPQWDAFFLTAKKVNREIEAFAKAAKYHILNGDLTTADKHIAKIPGDSKYGRVRATLLLEKLSKQAQFAKREDGVEPIQAELSQVLHEIALNPNHTDLRADLVYCLEKTLDESLASLILVRCCQDAVKRAEHLFANSNASTEESPIEYAANQAAFDAAEKFMQTLAAVHRGNPLAETLLTEKYPAGAPDEVMAGLGMLVRLSTETPDANVIGGVLRSLNAACQSRREATWDMLCANQLLGALAIFGQFSGALNLAESILLMWPSSPSAFRSCRIAHAWAVYAEVYQRGRNPLIALLHFTICIESMTLLPAQQHASMLKHKLVLGARIFRDLHLNAISRSFISMAQALVHAIPQRDRETKELVTLEIQCRIHEISVMTSPDAFLELERLTITLLDDAKETEWGVPVAIGINLINIASWKRHQLSKHFVNLVTSKIPKCSAPLQRIFHRCLNEHPSYDDVKAAFEEMIVNNVNDDQGHQFGMMEGLLRRAIASGSQRNDPELFLLAASWLSQPALTASHANWQSDGERPEVKLANVTKVFPAGTESKATRVFDYSQALQQQIAKTDSYFKKIASIPIAAAPFVAAPNEALCLLAHDASGRLCRLVVRQGRVEQPVCLATEIWNRAELVNWRERYPEGYSWDRNYGTLAEFDTPDLSELRASLNKLQPTIPTDCETITILPEADLFGFTFFLGEKDGGWIGELTRCVTAPSLPWLAAVRQLPQPKLTSVKAWLGHPTLADMAVQRPRTELRPIVAQYRGHLVDSESPQALTGCDVAILLSHGSRGIFGSFVGFDDVGKFTVDQLSDWLGDCKCVILFVCNSGRSDGNVFSNETFGLIGRLLSRNVRAVIAPPAPLRNNLPAIWLGPFLQSIHEGHQVGEAHANACNAIRSQYSHPCAWGALQLFGDASLRFIAT